MPKKKSAIITKTASKKKSTKKRKIRDFRAQAPPHPYFRPSSQCGAVRCGGARSANYTCRVLPYRLSAQACHETVGF